MHEHLFIARHEGTEVSAKYPDKKTAESILEYIQDLEQKEYLSLDEKLRRRLENKLENPFQVLDLLAEKHPESFCVPYTLGDLLQDIDRPDDSIASYQQAFTHARHAAHRLKSALGIALSWKLLGIHAVDKSICSIKFGQETAAAEYANQALEHYTQARDSYSEAQTYSYAATPPLAFILEYSKASLFIALASLFIDMHTIYPKIKKHILPALNIAKAQKSLAMSITTHYDIKNTEQEFTHMNIDIENLEIKVSSIKNHQS